MPKTVLPPTTSAHDAWRLKFQSWLKDCAGEKLVKWTDLRMHVERKGNFSSKGAIQFMQSEGLQRRGIKNTETNVKNDDYVIQAEGPLRLVESWMHSDAGSEPPAGSEPSCSSAAEADDYTKHLMVLAASFGLDTRLGIACFDLDDDNVTLHLEKLEMAIQACAPQEAAGFAFARSKVLNGRPLNKDGSIILRDCELLLIRKASDSVFECGPCVVKRPTKKPAEIIKALQTQASTFTSWHGWGCTMVRDSSYTQNTIPAFLSKVVGRPVVIGPYHVQVGLWPTLQQMRTAAKVAADHATYGTIVEELEVSWVGRSVTWPP
jgi:hypothetical protein